MCEHLKDYGQVLIAIRNYILQAYITVQEDRWQEKNLPHRYVLVTGVPQPVTA